MDRNSVKVALCFLGAVVLPFLIEWAYLRLSITGGWDTVSSDYIALGVCSVVGLASIAALPVKTAMRIILAVVYAPTLSFALLIFAFSYVCGNFNNCL